jgi:hypothetical protein
VIPVQKDLWEFLVQLARLERVDRKDLWDHKDHKEILVLVHKDRRESPGHRVIRILVLVR